MAASGGLGTIHFKFKAALKSDTVTFDGHYISVGEVKRLIANKKGLGADAYAELELSDPGSLSVHSNDSAQLPRNSSVLVRRIPGQARKPGPGDRGGPRGAAAGGAGAAQAPVLLATALPTTVNEGDEFGGDPYEARTADREREDQLISAVVDAQQEAWRAETDRTILQQAQRGRGRAGRGMGRGLGVPEHYWCPHCGSRGHYARDCPKRNDPEAQAALKYVRAPAGIPMTMLNRTAGGTLLLPSGETVSLRHNEDLFEREVGAVPGAPPGTKAAAGALPGPNADGAEQLLHLDGRGMEAEEAAHAAPGAPAAASAGGGAGASEPLAIVPAGGGGLFDEDDPLQQAGNEASSLQLGLGMELGLPEAQQRGSKQQAAAQPAADDGGQDDLHRFLHELADVMPRGPMAALLRAFKAGQPLSEQDFQQLLTDYPNPNAPKAVAAAASGPGKPPSAGGDRGGRQQQACEEPARRHSPSRGQERSRPSSPNGHAASYGRKGSRRSPDRRHASPQRSRRSPERRRSRSPERRRHTDHQRSHHRPASPHQHQRHNASPGRRRESSRERARERQYTSSHARLRSRSRDRERQPPSRRDSGIGACSSMGEVTDLRQLLNRKRGQHTTHEPRKHGHSRERSRERSRSRSRRRERSHHHVRSRTRSLSSSPYQRTAANAARWEADDGYQRDERNPQGRQQRDSSEAEAPEPPVGESTLVDDRYVEQPAAARYASAELQNLLDEEPPAGQASGGSQGSPERSYGDEGERQGRQTRDASPAPSDEGGAAAGGGHRASSPAGHEGDEPAAAHTPSADGGSPEAERRRPAGDGEQPAERGGAALSTLPQQEDHDHGSKHHKHRSKEKHSKHKKEKKEKKSRKGKGRGRDSDGSDDEQRGRGRSRSASPRRAASRSASPRAGRCGGGEGGRADKAADEQRAEAGRKLPPRGTGPRSLFKSALQAASVAGSERERKRHRGD